MKQIIKNTLVLLIITLIAGISLACVQEVTKEPIKNAEEEAKNKAYETVMPEADSFGELDTDIDNFVFESSVALEEIKCAYDESGNKIGWVMSLVSSAGYGGDINIAIGVKNDGTLSAMTVVSMSETAGLGAKCTSDAFTSQFAGIKAEKVEYVKDGKQSPNQIDAISGATITTKAITNAVNEGLELAYTVLMQQG